MCDRAHIIRLDVRVLQGCFDKQKDIEHADNDRNTREFENEMAFAMSAYEQRLAVAHAAAKAALAATLEAGTGRAIKCSSFVASLRESTLPKSCPGTAAALSGRAYERRAVRRRQLR
jgi:hypothetical protein